MERDRSGERTLQKYRLQRQQQIGRSHSAHMLWALSLTTCRYVTLRQLQNVCYYAIIPNVTGDRKGYSIAWLIWNNVENTAVIQRLLSFADSCDVYTKRHTTLNHSSDNYHQPLLCYAAQRTTVDGHSLEGRITPLK